MTVGKRRKLNQLERSLPEGLIVDAAWLEARGYSASLRKQYVDRGWLDRPARGAYMRSRGELRWEQVVISLQTLLKLPVSVGPSVRWREMNLDKAGEETREEIAQKLETVLR